MRQNGCMLCPRTCHIDRKRAVGFCGVGDVLRVAQASLHKWEEPPISGVNGSGTIFFSGCTLRCCFCQNYKISAEGYGKEISVDDLCACMLRLQAQGAHNINFVTPTHYADKIVAALDKIRGSKLVIPTVYNSSGYETAETLKLLKGYIDVYMPDMKYYSPAIAARYSSARDYFAYASRAALLMFNQVGEPVFDQNGLLQRGLLLRHMVLPGAYRDSIQILDWIAEHFAPESVLLSLMCQYTPQYHSAHFPEIDRRLTTFEYHKVVEHAAALGLQGFMQARSAAKEAYIPAFDLRGV